MSLAIGLVLAIGVAFGLDYMNDTIKTPEDVTRRLKLPFLGLVPSVRGDKHPAARPRRTCRTISASRSGRCGRRSSRSSSETAPRSSSSPARSRSKARRRPPANIAMALAYGGSRVLLIDADMRRPGLHRPLRLTNERGLSQVLIGQARVRDVIQRTVDPNLLAITAGTDAAQPVGAARVGAHEDAAHQPVARAVRLDHHRHAAGARGHRRRDPGAAVVAA